MKVIVTGGAGFIGSHLIERLIKIKKISKIYLIDNFKDGNNKNILSFYNNKKIIILKKDIRKIKHNEKSFKNVKIIFHLAAIADIVPSINKPEDYFTTNVNGTIKILEAMKFNKIPRIIYAASSSCYGIPKKFPTNENQKIDPIYPYAFSKYVSELTIQHWCKVYNLKYISLRIFNVYGDRSRTTGAYGAVMGVFMKQKLSGYPLTLVKDGNQKRDFVHVKDVVDAFIKAMNSNIYNEIFNIGAGKPIKIINLVKMISNNYVFINKRPGEPRQTFANINKSKKLLKWKPKINFKSGIKMLLKNINYWKDSDLWTPSKIKIATKEWFKYLK